MRKVLYILGGLEDSDLQWLYDAGKPRYVTENSPIIEEGVRVDSLYIVVEGEFRVSKGDRELARLGVGEVLGDMSLLDSRPASASVTAVADSMAYEVPQSRLRSKLASDPHFGTRFYRALCIFLVNRLSRTDAMVGAAGRIALDENEQDDDEISPDALDQVSLAGARFDWFRQRVLNG